MKISCVVSADELSDSADVIVFPEGVHLEEVKKAAARYPSAIVAGAVLERKCWPLVGKNWERHRCRGIVWHDGKPRIDYLKILTDSRTSTGCQDISQLPVYETPEICLGMIICMDVQHSQFLASVIQRVKTSEANYKLICVPAEMASAWFNGGIDSVFHGVYVAVCNHVRFYRGAGRCKSFIASDTQERIVTQRDEESIHYVFPKT